MASHILSIYYQNVRGLNTKLNELSTNILSNDYSIIALTETWLDSSVYDCEVCKEQYRVYRVDRVRGSTGRGGGVLTAVKEGLAVLKAEPVSSSFEGLLLKISIHGQTWFIVNVYIPPSSKVEVYCQAFQWLESHYEMQDGNLILIGDMNIPSITDNNCDLNATEQSRELKNFINLYNLNSCNSIQNSNNKTLDLVLTSHSIMNVKCTRNTDPLLAEDLHHPALDIAMQAASKSKKREIGCQTLYNFKNANF